jgi:type IV conjugative transfer system lipoprotein TraV
MKKILSISILLFLLTACASDYPCGEPRTGKCSNVTMNYDASMQGVVNPDDLPINGSSAPGCGNGVCKPSKVNQTISKYSQDSKYPQVPANGSPLLSSPDMMRVWYSPYVDSDNIYHDQEYQYMIIDRGHWLYGSNAAFGRNVPNLSGNTTKLIQSTNDSLNSDNQGADQAAQNVTKMSSLNQPSNTPALDFLKQQESMTTSNMGLGK